MSQEYEYRLYVMESRAELHAFYFGFPPIEKRRECHDDRNHQAIFVDPQSSCLVLLSQWREDFLDEYIMGGVEEDGRPEALRSERKISHDDRHAYDHQGKATQLNRRITATIGNDYREVPSGPYEAADQGDTAKWQYFAKLPDEKPAPSDFLANDRPERLDQLHRRQKAGHDQKRGPYASGLKTKLGRPFRYGFAVRPPA